MSERISIVVPDGTRERLKKTAEYHKRTQSNCAMRYVLNGLSFEEPTCEVVKQEVVILPIGDVKL